MAHARVSCPYCQLRRTKHNGRRKRLHGWTVRYRCLACGRYFTLRSHPRQRISWRKQVAITRQHLEGRSSIRTIARHSGHAKQTVMEAIHTVTAQCVSAAWTAKNLRPQWSGYLALDGKIVRVWDWAAKHFRYTKMERRWLHKLSLLLALDLGTLDVPSHWLGDDETAIDLTLFLRTLKENGYPLKGFVSDGNMDIPRAVERVFGPGIPHQLCVVHYLRNLRIKLHQGLILPPVYQDACQHILAGKEPQFLAVPPTLFTYLKEPGLPRTNQAVENCIRFFELRLKTLGQFQSFRTARHYLDALVLSRRFIPFTDRKGQPNGKSPLELAGCNLTGLDYLTLHAKAADN